MVVPSFDKVIYRIYPRIIANRVQDQISTAFLQIQTVSSHLLPTGKHEASVNSIWWVAGQYNSPSLAIKPALPAFCAPTSITFYGSPIM